jgi:RimJ/RimL family protein N-acetyltransferase
MTNTVVVEPVVSSLCEEPEGSIERHVYPMALSIDNLKEVWERSKEHATLFSQEVRQDFAKFISLFVKEGKSGLEATGLFWVIDDFVGVFFLTEIMENDALVHYSFFDGRFKGRTELVKEMLRYVFNKYGFVRLTGIVPVRAVPVWAFGKKVGFSEEGRKRKAVMYKGEWNDVLILGILREEVFDGR